MDKPTSMSVKDYLMRKQSVRTNKPLKIIEAVIEHQLQGANEALKDKNSIELSGFGKLIFNIKKAQKKLEKQYSKERWFSKELLNDLSDTKRKSVELKLENTRKAIESIKPKLHGIHTNIGGLEEQADSSFTFEGDDRGSLEGEDDNLQGV